MYAERASVAFVHGVPQHPVIAPVVMAVEGIDRHQFDEVDAEFHEVVEPIDGGCQGPLGRKGADMQLIDDAAPELTPRPHLIRPDELVRIESPRPAMHPVRLAPRAWIRQHGVGVVEQEAVIKLADALCPRSDTVRQGLSRAPPALVVALHGHSCRGALPHWFDHQRYR